MGATAYATDLNASNNAIVGNTAYTKDLNASNNAIVGNTAYAKDLNASNNAIVGHTAYTKDLNASNNAIVGNTAYVSNLYASNNATVNGGNLYGPATTGTTMFIAPTTPTVNIGLTTGSCNLNSTTYAKNGFSQNYIEITGNTAGDATWYGSFIELKGSGPITITLPNVYTNGTSNASPTIIIWNNTGISVTINTTSPSHFYGPGYSGQSSITIGAGQVLQFRGDTFNWIDLTSTSSLSGGIANAIPYQNDSNVTSFSSNLTFNSYTNTLSATYFNATSDYRIKDNVEPLDESDSIDQLRPVKYVLKDSGKPNMGFIAHEVQEVFPFLVAGEKDGPNTQSLNYNGLIAVLTKEIQDLKKRVKELEDKSDK